MFTTKHCLGCYEPIASDIFHAKCAFNLFGSYEPPILDDSWEDLSAIKRGMFENRIALTGVQKKLSLGHVSAAQNRLTIIGGMDGNYIMKPQSDDYPNLPENEDLCMHLAQECGIRVAMHGLLPTSKGDLVYITRRFDRESGRKVAVEDFCQLSDLLTEQKYRSSCERVGKIIKQFSSIPGDDVLRFFELTVFSFIIGNNDMHLKNFSLVTENLKKITLSPAYDLLSIRLVVSKAEDPEELALSVNGKKNKITLSDFLSLAMNLKIPPKVAQHVFKRMKDKKESMMQLIDKSFLPAPLKVDLKALVTKNLARL
jgi:serine/threonine-protein kinase HipA